MPPPLRALAEHDDDQLDPLDGTTAAMTIAGATDTEVFRAYVERGALPDACAGATSWSWTTSAAHKSPATLELIQAAGADVRFLPAYSPDLNPIEKMWSKGALTMDFPVEVRRERESGSIPDSSTAVTVGQ